MNDDYANMNYSKVKLTPSGIPKPEPSVPKGLPKDVPPARDPGPMMPSTAGDRKMELEMRKCKTVIPLGFENYP